MGVDLWLVYIARLAAGIMAISAHYSPVNQQRATAYAVAATYYGLAAGEDPYELVAVARNESDFIENQKGPDGLDCGLTQTRVTVSKFSCNQLRRDYRIAFAEAARELSEYRKSCRYAPDYDRCRINKYNSGVRYAKTGDHGNYYLRVLCFADAARAGLDVGNDCRRVKARSHITRLIERTQKRQATPVASLSLFGKRG